jgi:hypothetical protein
MKKKIDYGFSVGQHVLIKDGCWSKGIIIDKTFDTDYGWMYKVDLGDGVCVWMIESLIGERVLN